MSAFSVQGQRKATVLLSRALARDRLAHAYLFVGPDGVGKTTMAREMAAHLLCSQPSLSVYGNGASDPVPLACGACPACLQYRAGNHPDYLSMRPQGISISIDQVRALKKQLRFSPFSGGRRVILMEGVETLRQAAGNSLLKILEEPPANTFFLLLASSSGTLLPTLVSRCQSIPFYPLEPHLAAEIIEQHAPEPMEKEEALALATLFNGCPGQALVAETDALMDCFQQLQQALVQPYREESRRVERALLLARQAAALDDEIRILLQLVRLLLFEAMPGAEFSTMATGSRQVARMREIWSLETLSGKVQAVDLAEKALSAHCNKGLVCEVLMQDLFACD